MSKREYILVLNYPKLSNCSVICRCSEDKLKEMFDLYKKEYPLNDIKIYKEVVLK